MATFRNDFRRSGPLFGHAERASAQVAMPPFPGTATRRCDVQALMPDGSIESRHMSVPASPLFEEAATAFARGTLIPTDHGPVAIEDLMPGDRVECAVGYQTVTWISCTPFRADPDGPAENHNWLTRITADAFGMGHPPVDLMVGPGARMVYRNSRLEALIGQDMVLVPVSDFVDGDRFLQIMPVGEIQTYHFMVGRHTTFSVGGLEMETYHPGKATAQLSSQAMRTLFLSMFPHIDALDVFGQVNYTRTTRATVESLLDTA